MAKKAIKSGVEGEEEQQEMDQEITKRENEGGEREEKAEEDMSGTNGSDGIENVESGDYLTEPQTPLSAHSSHGSLATYEWREGGRPNSLEDDFIHSGLPSPAPDEGSGTKGSGYLSQEKEMEELSLALSSGTNDLCPPVKSQPPVLIAVMGKTGTGKTSFVNAVTGRGLTVGHGLEACTQDIQTAITNINGREVRLIDTPGFDDTHRSDTDILSTIANWVQQTNNERKHLSGIVYFHRIVDTRMEGSNMKNLRMFRELCGEKNFSNVILCTTMWDKVDEEEGRRREEELKSKETFWGSLVSRGAQVIRHRGPDFTTSARKIAESFIQKDTIVLQLQEELDQNGSLSNTSAGRFLTSEIEDIKKKNQEEVAALRTEMKANDSKKEMELLKKQHKKEVEGLKKATNDLEKLRREDTKRFNKKVQQKQRQLKNRRRQPACIVC